MIGAIVALLFAAWFFRSAKRVGRHPWGWAVVGVLSFYLPVFLLGLVIAILVPQLVSRFESTTAVAAGLGLAVSALVVGAVCATLVRKAFLQQSSSWSFRAAARHFTTSRSLGTAHISGVLFLVLLASGILRFLWSMAAPRVFAPTVKAPQFEAMWFVIILASIVLSAAGATLILAKLRSWIVIPLAWTILITLLFVAKQHGFSHLLLDEGFRRMTERSLNWIVFLSVFVTAFIPMFLVTAGTRLWGGRWWVFLLGAVVGHAVVQIPVANQLLSSGVQRWDLIASPLVDGLLWGGGLYLGLLATVEPLEREKEVEVGAQVRSDIPSAAMPEREIASLPAPSPEEQRAKDRAVSDQRVITACGFAGAATFFILNLTTGTVPGGFIGGAIGGGLGGAIGVIINALRPK